MKVNGKVVVVTGAGNGMGREITLELVRRGAKVAAVDMRQDYLDETKKLATALGGTVETFVVDVTDAAKVAALPAAVEKKIRGMLTDDRPPKTDSGWMQRFNELAAKVCSKYPDAKPPFTAA